MPDGLRIVIGADLSAATQAIGNLNDSLAGVGSAAQDAAQGLNRIPAALRPINPTQMNNLRDAVSRLRQDIANIPRNPLPNPFPGITAGANQAGAALTNVGRVAQDLPFGFIGIQNNLNPLLESFQRLRAETGSSRAAFAALGSSLIGAGGIGLALSVVSSAIVIFQNGIAGFNSKAKEAKKEADELAKAIRSIGLVQQEATAGVEGQIAQVNALAAAISDSNQPYAQRKRALEELKDINKAYFADLKLEDAATGALTKTVDEYTKALINNAIQKGFVDEIASVAKAVAKQDDVIAKSRLKLAQATAEKNKIAEEERKSEQDRVRGTVALNAGSVKVTEAEKEEAKALENLRQENEKVTTLLTQEAVLREQLNKAVLEGTKFKDLDTDNGKKERDGLNKQLDLLEKIRDAAKEFQVKLFDLKDIDAATDKLAGLEQQVGDLKLKIAIRDAKKAGLPPSEIERLSDAIKDDTQKRLNEAFEKEALLLEFNPKLKFNKVERLDTTDIAGRVFTNKEQLKVVLDGENLKFEVKDIPVDVTDLQGRIAKATGLDKKIPIITLHEARLKILGVELTNKIEFQEKILKELNDSFSQILSNIKVDAISGIAESLGEALAGGDIQNVFKSLFSVIATGLQQFGKALIAYGVAQKAFQLATKSLNPALAIAAGAGLIVAGTALKASLPKFAEGGIVSGPMIGQVGERFRPEVILPLDRLPQLFKQIGGDSGGGTQLIPIINNEGLYLAMKRGERSAGRKF